MLKKIIANNHEQESKTTPQPTIQRLLYEIAKVAKDDSYHSMTPVEIARLLGVKRLTANERHAWSKYRQEFLRKKRQEEKTKIAEQRKYEAYKKRELLTFGLIGFDNETLCQKIVALERARNEKAYDDEGNERVKRGKETTDQLVRALAVHSEAQITLIAKQIKTFTPDQQKRAKDAIETILGNYYAYRLRHFDEFKLTQLTDSDLIELFTIIFEQEAKRTWENSLMFSISYRLDDLDDRRSVEEIKTRISHLKTTPGFTAQMRADLVRTIEEYLRRPSKVKKPPHKWA